MNESFQQSVDEAAAFLRSIGQHETVRLTSHLDADGLCAVAILKQALERLGLQTELCILPQLSRTAVHAFASEGHTTFIFLDTGSSHLTLIGEELAGRDVLVLDHHQTSGSLPDGMVFTNPVLHGYDGSRDACSATVSYLVARALDEKNVDLSALAIVGAVADAQEKLGIAGLNKEVLDSAVKEGFLAIERGLKLHGLQSKPLVPLLVSSYDLRLPGVTGSPDGARALLAGVRIFDRERGGRPRKYVDLTLAERVRLSEKIASLVPETNVFVDHYVLPKEYGYFRDAREYATLLNACGRLDRAELGIAMASGDDDARRKARDVKAEYGEMLGAAHKLYEEGEVVTRGDGYVIINASNKIMASIAGTLASIVARGGDVPKGTLVMALARDVAGSTKISLRVAGYESTVDLKAVLEELVNAVGGECGGHTQAAGALIPTEKEEEFVELARERLGRA